MSVSMIASSARIMEAVNAKVKKRGESIVDDDVSLVVFEYLGCINMEDDHHKCASLVHKEFYS